MSRAYGVPAARRTRRRQGSRAWLRAWAAGLALAATLACAEEEAREGRWRAAHAPAHSGLDAEQLAEIERLRALGYATGSVEAPTLTGVTRHDPERAWNAPNLYTSGHGPEALLIGMDGRVLHRWRYPYWGQPPTDAPPFLSENHTYWRRVHLFENGDLIAIFSGLGLLKVDRDSNLLWSSDVPAHHDLQVMPDGRIFVLSRRAHMLPDIQPDSPILEDFVSVLDSEGHELHRVSLLAALQRSEYAHLWPGSPGNAGDVFHTNSLEVLDGRLADRIPEFRAGNVLVSMLKLDAIAVLDLDQEKIVWAMTGDYERQHDPTVLDDGNLLLFDNGSASESRALEIDPVSGEILWSFGGSEAQPLYTRWCGAAQRLPNGNTLLSETDPGRALEVTPEGELVWEFYNPHRTGKSDELIASLFEALRIPPDFPIGWAHGPESDQASRQ